jgi:hypothetical protein
MAKTQAEVVLTAEEAGVFRAFMKVNDQLRNTGKGLDNVGRKGQTAGQKMNKTFQKTMNDLPRAAMAVVGLGTALQGVATFAALVRKEVSAIRALQAGAAGHQIDVARAQMALSWTLTDREQAGPITDRLFAARTGVPHADLLREATAAVSSSLGTSQDQAIDTALAAARARPDMTTTDRSRLIQAALGLQVKFGTTPEKALAGAQQSLTASITPDMATWAQHGLGYIGAMRPLGGNKDSFKYLASRFTALQGHAQDFQARRTGSGMFNAFEFIKQEAAVAGLIPGDASLEEMEQAVLDPKNPRAAVLRKRLLGVFSREKDALSSEAMSLEGLQKAELQGQVRTKGGIMDWLDPTRTSLFWKNVYGESGSEARIYGLNDKAIAWAEEGRAHLATLPEQQAFEADLAMRSGVQLARGNVPRGVTGATSESLKELLQMTGAWATEAELEQLFHDLKGASSDSAQDIFQDTADRLSEQRRRITVVQKSRDVAYMGPFGGGMMKTPGRSLTRGEKEDVAALTAAIEGLTERIDALQEGPAKEVVIEHADGSRTAGKAGPAELSEEGPKAP